MHQAPRASGPSGTDGGLWLLSRGLRFRAEFCRHLLQQGLEGLGLAHRKISQNFPVDRDAREVEAANKSAVSERTPIVLLEAELTHGGVDALNPEAAEIALPV